MKEVPGGLQLGTLFGFPLFVSTFHLGALPAVMFWMFVAGMNAGGEIEDGFIFVLIMNSLRPSGDWEIPRPTMS